MKHIRPIARAPRLAQLGTMTPLEQIIVFALGLIFDDWVNFQPVIQNLQKFYQKTP